MAGSCDMPGRCDALDGATQALRWSACATAHLSASVRSASAILTLRRLAPQRSLPPCGGGTGRGVATSTEFVVTPLPTPPPQRGREQTAAAASTVLSR